MLRWLIQDVDTKNENSVHPYIKGLFQLTEKGLDQPFWFGISYEALKAFLIYANFSIDELTSNNLNGVVRDIAKIKLPSEMRNQIRRLILNEGLLDSKFEVEILIFVPEEPTYKLPWDPLCESSAIGVEGVFQSIKACWSSLFHPTILNSLNSMGLDYSKVNISLFIRVHQQELMRGSAYSYSPRSPWDRQHLVVSQTTIKDQAAFLVDRNTLQITYYGKSGEELLGAAKKLKTSKLNPHKNLPDHEKIKKIAGFLLSCEKNLGKEQQLEWSITSEQRILIRRISSFVRSPSTQQMSPQINTNFLNFWDQTILSWNASALLKPFWFSLLPRNFRALSIRYAGILGIKSKLPPEYEKVFRGFWGILRGRPYLNLAAFHRFISIGQHKELAEELSLIIPHWMKRYDRESRDAWDFQWPKTIQFNKEFSKNILKNQNKILKEFPEKLNTKSLKDYAVVYVGAAHGFHFPILYNLFPELIWLLYDPARFSKEAYMHPQKEKVKIYNQFFTDDTINHVKQNAENKKILFISDIRLSPDEEAVMKDMISQAKWGTELGADFMLLKYKPPYNDENIKLYKTNTILYT